jgi:hypothetical protein
LKGFIMGAWVGSMHPLFWLLSKKKYEIPSI